MNEQLRQAIEAASQMSDEAQSVIATRILEEIKQQKRNAILSQPLALNKLLQEKREDILRIAKGYGASNIRVFGSVARGESDAKSDIDLLVDLEQGRNLLDLGGLLMDLQDLLDHKVDVATEQILRSHIREQVLKEAIPL
jgi:hypothetical protein